MSNPNGARGATLERDTRTFLADVFGRLVRRPRQEGAVDVGDLHLSPFVLQCKNYADIPTGIREGVKGAEAQALAADEDYGVAVLKTRGKGIADARVVMSLRTFRRLAARLLRAEALLQRWAPGEFEKHTAAIKEDA